MPQNSNKTLNITYHFDYISHSVLNATKKAHSRKNASVLLLYLFFITLTFAITALFPTSPRRRTPNALSTIFFRFHNIKNSAAYNNQQYTDNYDICHAAIPFFEVAAFLLFTTVIVTTTTTNESTTNSPGTKPAPNSPVVISVPI